MGIGAIGALNGACWIFQVAGLATISSLGALLTWLMVSYIEPFKDDSSKYYVHDPVSLTIIAAIISFLIAFIFMIVFDTVSDAILYCFATEKHRQRLHGGKCVRRPSEQHLLDASSEPAVALREDSTSECENGDGLYAPLT